jgi:hypothetical protein
VVVNGESVNIGFKPIFSVGDVVTLNVEEKFGELKMVTAGAATTSASSSPGTKPTSFTGGKNTVFPVPHTHGDMAIIRQNALTNAVNWWNINNTVAMERDEAIEEMIKIAYKFAEFSSGHREERILRETGSKVIKAA